MIKERFNVLAPSQAQKVKEAKLAIVEAKKKGSKSDELGARLDAIERMLDLD